MKSAASLSSVVAFLVVTFVVATGPMLRAQPAAAPSPAETKTSSPEELTPAELLKSYLQVREQLHATQLAVVNNRVEAETSARVQAAAITEKLEAIKSAMAAERERHQVETQRLNAERERQQLESQRSIRTVLWVAGTFGCLGLLAMLLMPLFQWRAINRLAEASAARLPLTAGQPALLADGPTPSDQTVTLSNQRLMSVVERMERRILELEQTAAAPLQAGPEPRKSVTDSAPAPSLTVATDSGSGRLESSEPVTVTLAGAPSETVHRNGTVHAADAAARLANLLSKARTLASTNKPREAVAAYDEVLRLNPNHVEALLKKGAELEKLMRNEDAIGCYDRAIELDRKMTLAYLYKGGVCNRLGRYDEALECYELAMQVQEAGK